MRDMFEATAPVGVCCAAKLPVKLKRPSQLNFHDVDDASVSIWTRAAGKKITCVTGAPLESRNGEVDLMSIPGKWYIACLCHIGDSRLMEMADALGCSRRCAADRDRPNQATFPSFSCEHSGPADLNAARNIQARTTVTAPLSSQAASSA
jgi:hypothetical protein